MATIDMGRKQEKGLLCPFRGRAGPPLTHCGLGRGLYIRAKWRLHPSSRLVTTDMDRKLGAVPILGGSCNPI